MADDVLLPLRLTREAFIRKEERRVERAAAQVIGSCLTAAARGWDASTARMDWAVVDARDIDVTPILDVVGDLYGTAYADAATTLYDGVTAAAMPSTDAAVTAHLATVSNRLANVPDSVFDTIRAELEAGRLAGESIPNLAARIDGVLSFTGQANWRNRATTIARTETIAAYNHGHLTGIREMSAAVGIDGMRKQWLATGDSLTRETHAEADGQIVGQDELFAVGGDLLEYPGDPGGSPEEVINCRCTMEFVTPEDYDAMQRADAEHAAEVLLSDAAAVEPEVTSILSSLSTELGGTMEGLEYRLKGMGSLTDKIASRMALGQTPAEAAASISDAVRYTTLFPDESYAANVGAMLERLEQAGFRFTVKNYWGHPTNPYRGINVAMTRNGQPVELQFHTRASFDKKMGRMHQLYEQYRYADDPAVAARLEQEMWREMNSLREPRGARHVGVGGIVGGGGEDHDHDVHRAHPEGTAAVPGGRAPPARALGRRDPVVGDRAHGVPTTVDRLAVGTGGTDRGRSPASGPRGIPALGHPSSLKENPAMTITAADQQSPPTANAIPTDGPPFHGVLAPEGVRTGDRRSFNVNALTWRDLPLPFRVQVADAPGHDGAVRVGRIDDIWRDDTGPVVKIRFAGVWATTSEGDLTDAAKSARDEVLSGVLRGVSVDLDDVTIELLDGDTGEPMAEGDEVDFLDFLMGGDEPLVNVTAGRIASAAACSIPAFQEAYVADGPFEPGKREPGDGQEKPIVQASSFAGFMPDGETPCSCDEADTDYDPDCECPPADEMMTSVDGVTFVSEKPWGGFSEADYTPQQWRDATLIHLDPADGQDPLAKSLHKLPVYEPAGALNRGGCHAAASVLGGGRGGVDAPPEKQQAAARTLVGLYRNQLNEDPPPSLLSKAGMAAEESGDAVQASAFTLTASLTPLYPSADFTDPGFHEDDGRMVQAEDGTWGCPLTITDDGRIFGHLAKWGTCHIGFDGVCVEPPESRAAYAYFTTGCVTTDVGDLPVGQITVGTGHAAARLGAKPAMDHYDNTGTAAADVAVGDDAYGIWFAGRLRDNLSPEQIIALRHGGAVSGDWRRIGTALELVAALAVNVPGFPMPRRALAASGGVQTALVAAGVLAPRHVDEVTASAVARQVLGMLDRRNKVARLARKIGRDPASRVAAAARMIEEG